MNGSSVDQVHTDNLFAVAAQIPERAAIDGHIGSANAIILSIRHGGRRARITEQGGSRANDQVAGNGFYAAAFGETEGSLVDECVPGISVGAVAEEDEEARSDLGEGTGAGKGAAELQGAGGTDVQGGGGNHQARTGQSGSDARRHVQRPKRAVDAITEQLVALAQRGVGVQF